MQKIYFIIIVILGSFNTMLQGQDDALKSVLTYGDFITIVKNNHPIAQRARLLRPKGEQIIRSAKGGFDPQLYTYFDQKEFDKKSYFRNLSAGVKVPTNFGAEFKAGYDNNQGIYINNVAIEGADQTLSKSDLASETALVLRKGKKNYCVVKFK